MANHGPNEEIFGENFVVDIVISPGHSYWVKKGGLTMQHGAQIVKRAELVSGRGIRGDRYFGRRLNHKSQVTFISLEAIDEIRREFDLPELPVTVFRRNLVVSGLKFADLLGRRFQIQGVEFEGTQECAPCHWMDHVVAEGARKFMMAHFRGGLRAKILCDGFIECNKIVGVN